MNSLTFILLLPEREKREEEREVGEEEEKGEKKREEEGEKKMAERKSKEVKTHLK